MIDPVSENTPYLTPITPPEASHKASELQRLENAYLTLPQSSEIGAHLVAPVQKENIQAVLVNQIKHGDRPCAFSHFPLVAASVLLNLPKGRE